MLTYALARRPDEFGLVPDADGYVKITVLVQSCRNQGIMFEQAGEGLFLADRIPPGGFSAPALPPEKRAEARPPETPGGFVIDAGDVLQSTDPDYRRRTAKGKKIDSKRFKREKWLREKPPWRE